MADISRLMPIAADADFTPYPEASGGYTLLELLIVCALISMTLAVTMPSLRGWEFGDQLKSAARKTIGLVKEARMQAESHQRAIYLYLGQSENRIWYEVDSDWRGNTYTILEPDESDPEQRQEQQDADETLKGELILPDSIRIAELRVNRVEPDSTAGTTRVWITPQGLMLETMIQLESEDGRSLKLFFSPFLETVSIKE